MLQRPPQTCGRGPFRREGEEESRCQSHSVVPRRQLLPRWAGQTRPWWGSRRSPQADRQADEPFCFLWVQFPCHRRKVPIAKHPGSRVPHSGQALGRQVPRQLEKPKSLGFNTVVASAVCFCITINYFSHETVSFTNQVHIIGMVLYMLWYTALS